MLSELTRVTRAHLAPGPHLDGPNMRMGKRVLLDIDALLTSDEAGGENSVKLLEWSRHAIISASSHAVYGNNHPFLDPEIEAALWYVLYLSFKFSSRNFQQLIMIDQVVARVYPFTFCRARHFQVRVQAAPESVRRTHLVLQRLPKAIRRLRGCQGSVACPTTSRPVGGRGREAGSLPLYWHDREHSADLLLGGVGAILTACSTGRGPDGATRTGRAC